jgi:phosphatidylserine/phosphatidylglycerophosphate/cardiolipin synthase-like enzyme
MKNIAHSHYILFLLYGLLISSCTINQVAPVTQVSQSSEEESRIDVYFTDPGSILSQNYEGGPSDYLVEAIDGARVTIDIAAYNFNLWSIRDALINASKRGVKVRMVMESDNMDNREIRDLLDNDIQIVGDQQEGLMHDKFMIIDREEVWTGSMNFTVGGAYKDNNNLIRIRSSQISDLYSAEFEQMYSQRLFGITKDPINRIDQTNPDTLGIDVLFSPKGDVESNTISIIQNAKTSVIFLLYSFTLDDIGTELINKSREGLIVRGVMDQDQAYSNQGTEFYMLHDAGIDVKLDGNVNLMHHKVIIIDNEIVITGSYNFSNNAETRNDENVVIITDSRIAAQFLNEFELIYLQANP